MEPDQDRSPTSARSFADKGLDHLVLQRAVHYLVHEDQREVGLHRPEDPWHVELLPQKEAHLAGLAGISKFVRAAKQDQAGR